MHGQINIRCLSFIYRYSQQFNVDYSCDVAEGIGRGGKIARPPRSPDITPLDFSLWGYVKDKVFAPSLPASLGEVRTRITEAFATIDLHMIHRVWDEIAYGWDICRVTRGNHID